MNCRDCIHYDLCINHEECDFFKDYRKIIELPCDIGEKLYAINGKGEIKSWDILCVRARKSKLQWNPEHVEILLGCDAQRNILWINLDKTKNVYFSHEKAGQALKERAKNEHR